MSIHIEVPLEALGQPGVATALATLVRSLGNHKPSATAAPRETAQLKGPAAKRHSRPASRRGATADDLRHLPPAERWARYLEGRPERTHKFLQLLEERGRLTVDEAVSALNLSSPKAMGGLTGAMVRWAPKQGITLPFEARQDGSGQRYWVWKGA